MGRSIVTGKVREVDKIWLNLKEASAYLGISAWTLRKHKDSGMVSFYKVGGTILFAKKDLDNLVQCNKIT